MPFYIFFVHFISFSGLLHTAQFSAMKKCGGSVWTTMLKKVAAHLTVNHIVETGKLQALLKDNSCALRMLFHVIAEPSSRGSSGLPQLSENIS